MGGAGAAGAPFGQAGRLARGPMGGFGHGGAPLGGAGAAGAPSVAFGHTVRDGRVVPEVGLTAQGNGGAGDPFTALGGGR